MKTRFDTVAAVLYWIFIVIIWAIVLIGCGTRKKDIHRQRMDSIWYSRIENLAVQNNRLYNLMENIRIDKKEGWNAVVRNYDTAGRVTKKTVIKGESETIVKITRDERDSSAVKAFGSVQLDSGSVARESLDKKKDSDTTMLFNVPWYGWMIGVLGLLLMGYLVLKRWGMV